MARVKPWVKVVCLVLVVSLAGAALVSAVDLFLSFV